MSEIYHQSVTDGRSHATLSNMVYFGACSKTTTKCCVKQYAISF